MTDLDAFTAWLNEHEGFALVQERLFDEVKPGCAPNVLIDWLSAAYGVGVRSRDARIAMLEQDVIAFCAPWAVRYARDHGLPDGHLHPTHYDILERAGARMDDFTRAALSPSQPTGGETS